MKNKKNNKAFTLVELMGVITIIALISVLVAPTIINQIRSSKGRVDKVTEKLIFSATDLYLDENKDTFLLKEGNAYCVTLEDLVNDDKLQAPLLNSNGDEIDLSLYVKVAVINSQYGGYEITNECVEQIIDEV